MTVNSINGSPMAGPGMAPPPPREFTADQKSRVASILSNYDSSSLSSEDAREIHTAFKEAGFRAGAGLRQAIEEAGFDGETIRSLDPPPAERSMQGPGGPGGLGGPGRPGGAGGPGGANSFVGLNKENLSELQSILDGYDFNEMSSEQEGALLDELDASGLLMPGRLINIWT